MMNKQKNKHQATCYGQSSDYNDMKSDLNVSKNYRGEGL